MRVWQKDAWVCLTVADNGNTIAPEKVLEIREALRTGESAHRVGLINVYNRLVICKGEDSSLDIDALPEGGTVVTLRWQRDKPAVMA